MTPDEVDQKVSLEEALTQAQSGGGESQQGRMAGMPEAPAQEKAWEPPPYTKRWKEPSRKALEALYGLEPARPHWSTIQKEIDEIYSHAGRRDQEYAQFRKQWESLTPYREQYEPVYRMQGMTFDQGVGQLLSLADYLRTNPDEALPYLGQNFKPKDAAAVIRSLAQHWGVGADAFNDAPYIDDGVKSLVTPLQQEILALKQERQKEQIERQRQMHTALVEKVRALEAETDESGALKYPHLSTVWDNLVKLSNTGMFSDFGTLYQAAVSYHPELAKEVEERKSEEAKRRALEEAQARTASAEKASKAARNVSGKGAPVQSGKRKMTLEDALKSAAAELSG